MAMNGVSDFQYYADTVAKASERARRTFFLTTLLACGLFATLLDGFIFDWLGARQEFYGWYEVAEPRYKEYLKGTDVAASVSAYQVAHPGAKEKVTKSEISRLIEWQKTRPGFTVSEATDRITSLRVAKTARSRINLPLVEYSVDTNNLTLLAGYTVLFCLLLLKLALGRDLATLKSAYDVAHEAFDSDTAKDADSLQACRDLLGMGQVLINPQPGLSSAERVYFALLCFPPLVIGLQWASDFMTRNIAFQFNPTYAIATMTLGLACFMLSIALTIACFRLSREINTFWSLWEDKSPSSRYERDYQKRIMQRSEAQLKRPSGT